jgi:2-hydroxycyclohexanecarboxyl-CoA dehydrogenase
MTELLGRTALITGGSKGIGRGIAAAMAAAGARVIVNYGRDRQAAQDTVEALGGQAVAVQADISKAADVRRLFAEAGPVDVLVNNAAVDVIGRFVDSTEDTWDRIIAVNLRGTITMTRAVLDQMIERGSGRIIHIASDAGRVGSSGEVVYSATKGGVIAFGKALAREVARHAITVNSVCPGPTDTALLGQVAAYSQGMYDATLKAIPLRRVAEPDDIAGVVAFLASDAAAYMTGQTLSVSGGLTMV